MRDIDFFAKLLRLEWPWKVDRVSLSPEEKEIHVWLLTWRYGAGGTWITANVRRDCTHDAALDHDVHYWRGGKTVPSNARLARRLCNNSRP